MHPAKSLDFHDLYTGLYRYETNGYIRTQTKGPLRIFSYTEKATFEREWNLFTRVARGLILDLAEKEIVALPFPKFFNYGEMNEALPDEPFEVYTKLDGSLIILFFYNGKWQCATRGSFQSDQALLAQNMLEEGCLPLAFFNPKFTYLFELVGPSNKIVISYPKDELVFLGAYNIYSGEEMKHEDFIEFAYRRGIKCANPHGFISIKDLCEVADNVLTKDEEGFVIKFKSGLRLKIKGAEYKRIHSLISKLSPLSVWDMLLNSPEQLERMRKELPEELWEDFDLIKEILEKQVLEIAKKVELEHRRMCQWTDKEVGLDLKNMEEPTRSLIFPRRKFGSLLEGKARRIIFNKMRPTGNLLEGFSPSSSLNRTQGELFSG